MRAANEKRGDDHGINLSKMRALAKRVKTNHPLAEELAQIGIHNPDLRSRAVAIGNELQVLADYPTAPGCTSPFAPIWIAEIVRRREGAN